MYIMKKDFSYLEGLLKGLDEEQQKKFMDLLLKAGGKKTGGDVGKIHVVDDGIFDERGIEPQEFITRTKIRKAYKAAKENK